MAGATGIADAKVLVGQVDGPTRRLNTNENGRFRLSIKVLRPGPFEAYFPGSPTATPAFATTSTPRVHWQVTATLLRRHGQWVVKGRIEPVESTRTVTVRLAGGGMRILPATRDGKFVRSFSRRPVSAGIAAGSGFAATTVVF